MIFEEQVRSCQICVRISPFLHARQYGKRNGRGPFFQNEVKNGRVFRPLLEIFDSINDMDSWLTAQELKSYLIVVIRNHVDPCNQYCDFDWSRARNVSLHSWQGAEQFVFNSVLMYDIKQKFWFCETPIGWPLGCVCKVKYSLKAIADLSDVASVPLYVWWDYQFWSLYREPFSFGYFVPLFRLRRGSWAISARFDLVIWLIQLQ